MNGTIWCLCVHNLTKVSAVNLSAACLSWFCQQGSDDRAAMNTEKEKEDVSSCNTIRVKR